MGTIYELYDLRAREFIDLGKLRGWQDDMGATTFDTSAELVVKFLAQRAMKLGGEPLQLALCADVGDAPDDGDWQEVD